MREMLLGLALLAGQQGAQQGTHMDICPILEQVILSHWSFLIFLL